MAVVVAFGLYARAQPSRDLAARERAWGQVIRPGDLVFQDLACGERCALIRDVTSSPYSHVGVVLEEQGERVVWEASGPVRSVPLGEWAMHGRDHLVAVYRPRAALLAHRARVEREVRRFAGRPYDGFYGWDEERIYCSELVAKAYRNALRRDLVLPHLVSLGVHEARVAELSGGRLTSATLMVTPVDLVTSGAFVRVVDELRP